MQQILDPVVNKWIKMDIYESSISKFEYKALATIGATIHTPLSF